MFKKKPIPKSETATKEIKKYICKACGMVFFNHSRKLLKKENKGLTCPFCESELWKRVKTK